MTKPFMLSICAALTAVFFLACAQTPTNANHLTSHDVDEALVGNDRDKHGCISSAGYTWSKLLGECVRVFERGIALQNATDSKATSAAFVIFAPTSKSNEAMSETIELFLPHKPGSLLLKRPLKRDNSESSPITWSDSSYTLTAVNSPKAPHKASAYALTHKGKIIYRK